LLAHTFALLSIPGKTCRAELNVWAFALTSSLVPYLRTRANLANQAIAFACALVPDLAWSALFLDALATASVWIPSERRAAFEAKSADAFALVFVPDLVPVAHLDAEAFALTSPGIQPLAYWAETVSALTAAGVVVPNLTRWASLDLFADALTLDLVEDLVQGALKNFAAQALARPRVPHLVSLAFFNLSAFAAAGL
jgi:hypothetical protein